MAGNFFAKASFTGTGTFAGLIFCDIPVSVMKKSAVDYPTRRKFLGFTFYYYKGLARIKVHAKPLNRLKAKLKNLTGRSIGISMESRTIKLNQTIRGWVNYYKVADICLIILLQIYLLDQEIVGCPYF